MKGCEEGETLQAVPAPADAAIDEAEAKTMETRANYALIGAFTLATIAAAFLFVYWFSGNQNPAGLKSYRVVFTSSVSGLSRGSSVLFNGLRVGEVTTIDLGEDPSQVYAMIDVDRRTPVKTDTNARLEYQGLTGFAAVALSGGSADEPAARSERARRPAANRRRAFRLPEYRREPAGPVVEGRFRSRRRPWAPCRQFRRDQADGSKRGEVQPDAGR